MPVDKSAPAGFLRRLLAMVYDGFLLIAVLLVAFFPAPLIPAEWHSLPAVRLGLQCYLFAVACFFFVWSWTRGGQTLGMRAWRLRLVAADGSGGVSVGRAVGRFAAAFLSTAVFGLGFFWIFLDPQRRAWHDILSKTYVVTVAKPSTTARR